MTIVDFLWLFVYLIVTICIANIGLCLLRMDLKKLLLLWMPLLDTIIGNNDLLQVGYYLSACWFINC